MRKETKTVPVYHIVDEERSIYVSDDGFEFDTEEECRKHEELLQKVQGMVLPDNPGMPSVCGYDDEDCTFVWYRIGGPEDLDLLEEYYEAGIFYKAEAKQAIHDGLVCIMETEEANADLFVFTLSATMESFRNWIRNFGYETEFRKQAEGNPGSPGIDGAASSKLFEMHMRYRQGLTVQREGLDESDEILCPVCRYGVARNDDFPEMRPKHCPECGTKLLYGPF